MGQKWAAKAARHYDNAIAGSSALRGAMLQMLALEHAEITGFFWGLLLWDLETVFDTVGLAVLSRSTA